jgi:hypothetical protein
VISWIVGGHRGEGVELCSGMDWRIWKSGLCLVKLCINISRMSHYLGLVTVGE